MRPSQSLSERATDPGNETFSRICSSNCIFENRLSQAWHCFEWFYIPSEHVLVCNMRGICPYFSS